MAARSLSTEPGFKNKNRQRLVRKAAWMEAERDGQYVYVLRCEVGGCGHEYGAVGIDVHARRCPRCQDGKPGLPVPPEAPGLFNGLW